MADTGSSRQAAATAIAFLAAVALGLSAGAMLAEGALLVPWWRSIPPGAFLDWYHENAERLVAFFGPLEVAAALLALAAAVLARNAWLVLSAALAVAILLAFPVYFQAVNASFATGSIPPDRVAGELARWASYHWVRTAIGIVAFAAAMRGRP